jgi:hypothetical protein
MNRFYIGEKVIALPEANDRYIVTREGWVGTVVGILDVHMIQVKDINGTGIYPVLCECFTPLPVFPQDTVLSYEERV